MSQVPSFVIINDNGAAVRAQINQVIAALRSTSSGATDIIVAAEITEMSTPFSGAPKIDNPTVNGRVSGELVTISGHRKLFQCVDTDTRA